MVCGGRRSRSFTALSKDNTLIVVIDEPVT
jgi:hypothetical protein